MFDLILAFEFFDRQSLELVLKHLPAARNPFSGTVYPFYVLIETSGANSQHDEEVLGMHALLKGD